MSKRGLPLGVGMRHDAHYVEELSERRPTPVGRFIAIDQLDPNPDQPRLEVGDLTDLTESIRQQGVLEPLLVKRSHIQGRWMIIAGERRWRASQNAGLRELPCIELDVDERAVAEIALIENMQRKDLTAWEEADGLAALRHKFGYTHEEIAKKIGKSRTTVTEAMNIASLPQNVRSECRRADITSKSVLLQIARQPDEPEMLSLLEQIVRRGLTRDGARHVRRGNTSEPVQRSQSGSYIFLAPSGEFRLEIKFSHSGVRIEDVEEALRLAGAHLSGENLK